MKPTGKNQGVLIWVRDSPPAKRRTVEVIAEVLHQVFAVHQTITAVGLVDEWTITHIPTGYAVCRRFNTRTQAKRCAEALVACGDWAAVKTPRAAKKFAPAVNAILRAHLTT